MQNDTKNTDDSDVFTLEYANKYAHRLCSSQDELAVALNCSRRTIARLLKEPGNPGKTANGSYRLDQWSEFYDKICEEIGTQNLLTPEKREQLTEIRLRRDTAVARREELLTAKLEGRLVELTDVKAQWREFYERLTTRLREAFIDIAGADGDRRYSEFVAAVHEYENELANTSGQ